MPIKAGGEEVQECQQDLFCGVNMAESDDPADMSDLERKHVPVITAPNSVRKGECFQVKVEVGKHLDHPNEPGHYINFVELYADHTYLGRTHFTHSKSCPTVTFTVQLDHIHKELRAFEFCNKHGTWEATKALSVQE